MTETEHISARERNMEECGYPYKFSVVIPVYNTEQYLEETVSSVLNQTIGFEENIQMILVNNATEDAAGDICKRFQEEYPDNVIYIELMENHGVCRARNIGRDAATGKYINFLDSDDCWHGNAFERVFDFFEGHYDEVDLVACRIRHFDATNAWHGLDWKFKRDGVISIHDQYAKVQLSLCSTFIKQEVAKAFNLDERVRHAEDAKYVAEIILEKQKYALLRSVTFFYRTRSTGTSVLQTVAQSISWYFDTPKYVFSYLFQYSKQKFGQVLPYVQYLIMYELQWRLKTPLPAQFTEKEKSCYLENMTDLLEEIEDYIIWEQGHLWREFKLYALSLKYHTNVAQKMETHGGGFYFRNIQIYPPRTAASIEVASLEFKKDSLIIEGRFCMVLVPEQYQLGVEIHEMFYEANLFSLDETMKRNSFGNQIHEILGFRVAVPLKLLEISGETKVFFKLFYSGIPVYLGFRTMFICKLTEKVSAAYWHKNGYIFSIKQETILVERATSVLLKQKEKALSKQLFTKKNWKLLAWRYLIRFVQNIRGKQAKPIWLISDSFETADDNGEAFFRYVMEQKNAGIRPYFVLDKLSPDYERLRSIGPVIHADSKLYRLMFALSDKVISSRSFYNTLNTFYNRTELLQDLFHFDFIYLQHGVIKDNHADTQSKHKKNFSMFITSAQKEKDSIVQGIGGNYCYDESIVKLTGLARHDALVHLDPAKKKKKILLAPTWRREGMGAWCEQKQTYLYSETFKDTLFYKFYQSLMNDPRILHAMETHGYHMTVRLHPRTMQQACDFHADRLINLETRPSGYVEEIEETSLLVTDYSSIAFDYAYAQIPVIYTQFDVDTFYLNHGYKRGYFEYDTDGFGPVCYDYEATVQAIIGAIERDCIMEDMYKQRVNGFFAFRDGRNCERIYQEILKMDEGRENE